jgi:hypothetical protein
LYAPPTDAFKAAGVMPSTFDPRDVFHAGDFSDCALRRTGRRPVASSRVSFVIGRRQTKAGRRFPNPGDREDNVVAGPKLDSAGTNKLKTLDEQLLVLQRIHGVVEQYALAQKRNQPTAAYVMNLRRQLPTLAANLKNQFGMISDLVTSVNLSASRGASEQVRLRGLREGVAQIKQAIEIAMTQTKEKHKVVDEKHSAPEPKGGA